MFTLSVYTEVFAGFLIYVGFPGLVVLGSFFISIFVKKYEEKVPRIFQLLIDSVIVGALFGIGGFYLHFAISKLFFLFWLYPVAPILMLIFFCVAVGLHVYRKEKLI